MTVRHVQAAPCWVLKADLDAELIPHFETEDLAKAYLDDRAQDCLEPVSQAYEKACVEVVCDGEYCDLVLDLSGDDGATHLDPDDPLPCPITDLDWSEGDGKHYCPEHPPAEPESLRHRPSIRHLPAASGQTVMHLTGV